MIDINKTHLKELQKFHGYVRLPYYVGRCLTCSQNETCKKKKFESVTRKFNTTITADKVCSDWKIHIQFLTKLTNAKR